MFPVLQIFGIKKPSNQSIEIYMYGYIILFYFGLLEVHHILIFDKEGRFKGPIANSYCRLR